MGIISFSSVYHRPTGVDLQAFIISEDVHEREIHKMDTALVQGPSEGSPRSHLYASLRGVSSFPIAASNLRCHFPSSNQVKGSKGR